MRGFHRLVSCMGWMACLLLLLVLVSHTGTATAEVHGALEVVEGKYVLTVWGTHAERGHAAGFLLGEQAKTVFDEYFIDYFCGGSAGLYNYCRNLFTSSFTVDAEYQAEAAAVHDGMVAAGVDLHNEVLGREIDAVDFLVCNAIVDLSQYGDRFNAEGDQPFGCSSLSSWGTSTLEDPELGGHLVITRHLDWSKHPVLTDNAAIVVHLPAEDDEQPWVSMTYAGLMGALSGVSHARVGAFLNMGNVTTGTQGAPFHPILFALRTGLEKADYNGDGRHGADDIEEAFADRSRCAAVIVHVADDEGVGSVPVVVECNNAAGVATRTVAENTVIPGEHLVATNHFRALYNPVYCSRYQALADSLTANGAMTCARSWDVMAGAAGQPSNIMAIQFVPSQDVLACAVDTYTQPAYLQTPTVFDLGTLFGDDPAAVEENGGGVHIRSGEPDGSVPWAAHGSTPEGIGGIILTAAPNPFRQETVLTYELGVDTSLWLEIFGPTGRRIRAIELGSETVGRHTVSWDGRDARGRKASPGVYLCRLGSTAHELGHVSGKDAGLGGGLDTGPVTSWGRSYKLLIVD